MKTEVWSKWTCRVLARNCQRFMADLIIVMLSR